MKERTEIPEKYKWNPSDIFSSIEKWQVELTAVENELDGFTDFKGLLDNPEKLLKCLTFKDEIEKRLSLLHLYIYIKADEDIRIGENQAFLAEVIKLAAKYNSETSFINVELLKLGSERLNTLSNEEGLQVYKHFFDNISRSEVHTLGKEEEVILAELSELDHSSPNIFNVLNNVNILFEDVEDKNGEKHKLTNGVYSVYLESDDRILRENTVYNSNKEYARVKDTLAQIYVEHLKKDRISAKIRKYNSVLEMKLSEDNMPLGVYDNILKVVGENLKPLHKLLGMRKKVLNIDELYSYDMFVPLLKEVDIKIIYEEASATVLESVKLLGEDYYKITKSGFENGWIDVYENVGKSSGAYSGSVPGAHPFILMNYNDTYGSMFTLAHEMGHAVHSELANNNQPQVYSGYSSFIAEIASTLNEGLLFEHLMDITTDPKKRVYLLNKRIDEFWGTVIYQTTLAAFEKKAHELAAEGKASLETLSQVFIELRKKELGPLVNFPENSEYGWLRVPHFYRGFYVYKYATGFCASIALLDKIKTEGQPAVESYLNMLKSGGNDYPIELLKKAGVDLTTTAPIEAAMGYFSNLVDQLEEALTKI